MRFKKIYLNKIPTYLLEFILPKYQEQFLHINPFKNYLKKYLSRLQNYNYL